MKKKIWYQMSMLEALEQTLESPSSCPKTQELFSFPPPEKHDDTPKTPSSESESSSEQSKKCEQSPRRNTDNMRRGARPLGDKNQYRMVAVSAKGTPIGEDSPRAKYTDREIDEVFRLREEEGLSFSQIGRVLDMPKQTAWAVYVGRIRSHVVAGYKRRRV